MVWVYAEHALLGLGDALALLRVVRLLRASDFIRAKVGSSVVLNGLIFLGSMLVAALAVKPLMALALRALGFSALGFELLFDLLLYVLWLWPVYCLSFVLTGMWYGEIAGEACSILRKPRPDVSFDALRGRIRDELYRALLFGVLVAFCVLSAAVPLVGPFTAFLCLSWFNSFYAVDYTWGTSGEPLAVRLRRFERNWAYFLGFGAPITLATLQFPFLASSGLLALLFPFYLLCSASAEPPRDDPRCRPLKLFVPAQLVTNALVQALLWFVRSGGAAPAAATAGTASPRTASS